MAARHVRITGLFVLVLWCTTSPAMAQSRGGFWVGAGMGFGSAAVTCVDCERDRQGSGETYLTAGWALTDRLLVGGEVNLWRKSTTVDDIRGHVNLYNFLGTARFYPSASSGFFVKGGAGLSVVDTDLDLGGTDFSVEIGKGLALVGGAGYDIRLGPRLSITPAVSLWHGRLGDLMLFDEPIIESWKHNVVDFTVGITFH